MAETDVTVDSEHAYARFTRRVQGVFIDAIIFMLILAVALMLAVWFASDHIARILGVTVAATWLFYEPLLVPSPAARSATICATCGWLTTTVAISASSRLSPE